MPELSWPEGRTEIGAFPQFNHQFETERPVAPMKKTGGSRLVVVSNRVGVPDGSARAGGLEVAIRACAAAARRALVRLERQGRRSAGGAQNRRAGEHFLRHRRPAQGRLRRILQRLCQPGAVADSALPARSRRILAPRSRRLFPRQRILRAQSGKAAAARRHHLGARLSPDPARQGAARARSQEPHRLLHPHPVPAAGNPHRAAQPRAADPGARPFRPGRLPDRDRRRQFLALPRQ